MTSSVTVSYTHLDVYKRQGKTNEATKKNEEPLKQGQTQPTEKQEEKKVVKSKGIKM